MHYNERQKLILTPPTNYAKGKVRLKRRRRSNINVRLTVYCGLVRYKFILMGQTLDNEYYLENIQRLRLNRPKL